MNFLHIIFLSLIHMPSEPIVTTCSSSWNLGRSRAWANLMLQFAVIAKILQGFNEEVPKNSASSSLFPLVSFSIWLVGFLLDRLLDHNRKALLSVHWLPFSVDSLPSPGPWWAFSLWDCSCCLGSLSLRACCRTCPWASHYSAIGQTDFQHHGLSNFLATQKKNSVLRSCDQRTSLEHSLTLVSDLRGGVESLDQPKCCVCAETTLRMTQDPDQINDSNTPLRSLANVSEWCKEVRSSPPVRTLLSKYVGF